MRRTDASSGMFGKGRRRTVAGLGAGVLLGAGILVLAPRAAFATATPSDNGSDTFTGQTNNFNAVAGLSTGTISIGSFNDGDGSFGLSELSGVIQWGDGSSSPATVDDFTGAISGSHTYSTPGTYPVTVDFTDSDEGQVTLGDGNQGTTLLSDGTAYVSAPDIAGSSVNITPVENTPFTVVVANFTDADNPSCSLGLDVTAVIQWGDGNQSAGTPACDGTITGSHTYTGDEGATFPITVDVTDSDEPTGVLPDGGTGNAMLSGGTATLNDGVITPVPTSPTLVEGAGFSNLSLGTIKDADPAATPGDYSVAQTCFNDLGPNTPNDCVPATLTAVVNHPNWFTVSGSGTFLEEGSYNVQTMITDGEGPGAQEVTMNTPVTVNDAALTVSPVSTIQAKKGNTFSKIVANFKDADPNGTTSDYTASINWGDGSTTAGTIAPNGMGGWSVTGSHKYTTAKGFAVTVTVNDFGGASNSTVTQVRAK